MAATIAILQEGVPQEAVARALDVLRTAGHRGLAGSAGGRHLLIFTDQDEPALAAALHQLDSVEKTTLALDGAPLATGIAGPDRTVVDVAGTMIGDGSLAVIAGPCAVENQAQLTASADGAARHGAACLRAGAFKPRTSPYSFQGLGHDGLRLLAEAGAACGLPVVTEVVDTESLPQVAQHAHMLQIGARNAQNFSLLRAVARTGLPVLLKRGFGCTIDEWLAAAEYLLAGGNGSVVLCERGIRTYEGSTRYTLDLSAVPVIKRRSHLPVVVDPSHGTGHSYLVRPMALAAAAVGADGLLIDVHSEPQSALCDGLQALSLPEFAALTADLERLVASLGRRLATPRSARSLAANASAAA